MIKIVLVSLTLLLLALSCKVSEKSFVGMYQLEKSPKTRLIIHKDGGFEFSKNNRNPYLHPFDHPDQYFVNTKGSWKHSGKKKISITSQTDSLIYPLASIESTPVEENEESKFVFYDTYGDTIKILYVQYPDSSILISPHRTISYITDDMTNRDTLEFHFYGYRPFVFINQQKTNRNYNITLIPPFQPGFFRGVDFKIKKGQLIDVETKAKFRFVKREE